MITRTLLAVAPALTAPALATAQATSDSLLRRCGMSSSSECVYETSIIQLLARPEVFDGKKVRVLGYIHWEFEGNGIYLHREDEQRRLYRNGLWVQTKADAAIQDRCHNTYVLVEGTFKARNYGHMGLWAGAIVDITRCAPWG